MKSKKIGRCLFQDIFRLFVIMIVIISCDNTSLHKDNKSTETGYIGNDDDNKEIPSYTFKKDQLEFLSEFIYIPNKKNNFDIFINDRLEAKLEIPENALAQEQKISVFKIKPEFLYKDIISSGFVFEPDGIKFLDSANLSILVTSSVTETSKPKIAQIDYSEIEYFYLPRQSQSNDSSWISGTLEHLSAYAIVETSSATQSVETLCNDNIDNDYDGLIDCSDADCASFPKCTATQSVETLCNDNIDNDYDGLIDCSDADCASFPECIDPCSAGKINHPFTDTFIQKDKEKFDILFVIDSSGSMADEQDYISKNISSLVTFLQSQKIDYHIAVVTSDYQGDKGEFYHSGTNPSVITNTVTSTSVLAENLKVGYMGSAIEGGLESAYLALSEPMISNANKDFLRSDAVLSLVFISDEDDQSPQNVDFYADFFNQLKPKNMLSTTAMINLSPNSTAQRYNDVINKTHGTFAVIAASLSLWITTIQDEIEQTNRLRNFYLSFAPDVSSIKVSVNGISVIEDAATGFVYQGCDNKVSFYNDINVPDSGSAISIEYNIRCDGTLLCSLP